MARANDATKIDPEGDEGGEGRASMTREIVGAGAHESRDPEPRESGPAPARARFGSEPSYLETADDHLELAIAEGTRAEANLNSLLRGLNHLAAGTRAARDANAALSRELDVARDQLERASADEMVLRHRVRSLEQALATEKRDAQRERAAFILQEDAFLAELVEGHEKEIRDLKRRLAGALDRADRETLVPPAAPAALGSMKLKTVRIPLPTREDAPEDLERLSPPRPSSRPPLRQKADPSTRPLVEYRLGGGEVQEERFEGASRTTRPPPSDSSG